MENKANSQNLDAKLEMLDDQLNPLEELDVKSEEDTAEEEQAPDEEKVESEEVVDAEDSSVSEDSEDDGYVIDEGEEKEETPSPVAEQQGLNTANLTPEQQYIIDNLTPISVRGVVGDSDKIETFSVLDPSQLPQGFKFLDDRDRALVTKSFAMLENQAERLQNDFRNQSTQTAAKEFKEREDNADRSDIGRLQREGELPKFKADPDSKDFESDPATVLIQEIIDFKEATNDRYMQEYNAGRPYKHIGFEEAFKMFKRSNPVETAQAKEDAERTNIAKRTTKTRGSSDSPKQGPRVHSGSSSRDLDALIENLDW